MTPTPEVVVAYHDKDNNILRKLVEEKMEEDPKFKQKYKSF